MSFGTNVLPRRFGQNGKPPYKPGDVDRSAFERLLQHEITAADYVADLKRRVDELRCDRHPQ